VDKLCKRGERLYKLARQYNFKDMPDIIFLTKLFVISFGLNIIWEFAHCQLYATCRRQTWAQNIPLLIKMSLKDGFFIILFYVIATTLFPTSDILTSRTALLTFLALSLGFAFIDEKISVAAGRWEYAKAMPTIFGVGVTPLLEIAVTGLLAFLFTWHFGYLRIY
jgi:small-conductance mechanosensitive channel